ncbi:unnamed protein product [Microthlaspi erraticum]|uniref:Uncharacterized protein n=1 Tax=Microthlaspi erraticum TaxID=1685480 RepID=A0A6D2IQR8_9BRAS|nr:unnamed protein product [Microthlaspi erraticum]
MSTLRTVMETSPVLAKAAAHERVYKAINMRILALHPLTTVHSYKEIMARALSSDNVETHYIKAIIEGQMEEGTAYLDSLRWRENMAKGDRTWKSIKRTLHGMQVRELPIYKETLYEVGLIVMCD